MILSAEEQHTMMKSSSSTLETYIDDSTIEEFDVPDSRARQKKHPFWTTWMRSAKKRICPTRKCDPSHVIKEITLATTTPLPLRSCLASYSSPICDNRQKVKKSVTIQRGRPQKRKTIHLANYTREEIASTWYSSAEIELFKEKKLAKDEKRTQEMYEIIAELKRQCWQEEQQDSIGYFTTVPKRDVAVANNNEQDFFPFTVK